MKFVAVTSCPTGIAHTYMAAEALETAARAAGHEITVETQGAGGFEPIDADVIAAADAVIFAADVEVREKARFAGKPTVTASVKRGINEAATIIGEAEAAAEKGGVAAPEVHHTSKVDVPTGARTGAQIRGYLMTGVSYLIPFIAAGGILIAISFLLAGLADGKNGAVNIVHVTDSHDVTVAFLNAFSVTSLHDWAALLFLIGATAFGLINAVLGGYIAYAIADRPGLVPGFVGGIAAGTIGAGFLGAIAAGFIGGFLARWISHWKVPAGLRGVMPVVVIPLFATFVTAVLMLVVIGKPIASITDGLNNWLNSLEGGSLILLGVILGLMMAFDMGGPVNKVAYFFGATGLTEAISSNDATQLKVMAAVMAAGMVPPLALALATVLRRQLFSQAEREQGKAAWLLGASFITEGAIPFAAADPLRVIPSIMAGSALTGGLVMAFGNQLRAPHGGIWVIPLISKPFLYLLAIALGTVVSALLVISLKTVGRSKDDTALEADVDADLFSHATA
jgi:fructose PTS system EIIBC or EIIC component